MNIITRQEFKVLTCAVLLGICGMLGTDIHLASLPYIMVYLHTDQPHMQQSISIFLLGLGVSLLVYGPLSDGYGRKPVVIIGMVIAIVSSFATDWAHNIQIFLLMRLLQGIGSGVCMGLGRTIVADVLHGDRLSAIGSYFSLVITLSPLLAPALGGYVQHWFDWQTNFILLGFILLAVLLVYVVFCPETNQHKRPDAFKLSKLLCNYSSLLMHPLFVGATLLSGIAMAATMTYNTASAFILQDGFGLSPIMYGWVTALVGVGSIVGKLANPPAVKWFGSRCTLGLGLVLIAIAGLLIISIEWLLHIHSIVVMMIGVFIAIFGQCFIMPNTMARALSPFHDKRGSAGALYGGFQMLVAFVVSAVVGGFSHETALLLGHAYLLLGIVGVVIFKLLLRE